MDKKLTSEELQLDSATKEPYLIHLFAEVGSTAQLPTRKARFVVSSVYGFVFVFGVAVAWRQRVLANLGRRQLSSVARAGSSNPGRGFLDPAQVHGYTSVVWRTRQLRHTKCSVYREQHIGEMALRFLRPGHADSLHVALAGDWLLRAAGDSLLVRLQAGKCRLQGADLRTAFRHAAINAVEFHGTHGQRRLIALKSKDLFADQWSDFVFSEANRVRLQAGSLLDFHTWESCMTMPLDYDFSRGSPVSPALGFRRRSILISFHSHQVSRSRCSEQPKSLHLHSSVDGALHEQCCGRKCYPRYAIGIKSLECRSAQGVVGYCAAAVIILHLFPCANHRIKMGWTAYSSPAHAPNVDIPQSYTTVNVAWSTAMNVLWYEVVCVCVCVRACCVATSAVLWSVVVAGKWCPRRDWQSPADARVSSDARRGVLYSSVFLGSPGEYNARETVVDARYRKQAETFLLSVAAAIGGTQLIPRAVSWARGENWLTAGRGGGGRGARLAWSKSVRNSCTVSIATVSTHPAPPGEEPLPPPSSSVGLPPSAGLPRRLECFLRTRSSVDPGSSLRARLETTTKKSAPPSLFHDLQSLPAGPAANKSRGKIWRWWEDSKRRRRCRASRGKDKAGRDEREEGRKRIAHRRADSSSTTVVSSQLAAQPWALHVPVGERTVNPLVSPHPHPPPTRGPRPHALIGPSITCRPHASASNWFPRNNPSSFTIPGAEFWCVHILLRTRGYSFLGEMPSSPSINFGVYGRCKVKADIRRHTRDGCGTGCPGGSAPCERGGVAESSPTAAVTSARTIEQRALSDPCSSGGWRQPTQGSLLASCLKAHSVPLVAAYVPSDVQGCLVRSNQLKLRFETFFVRSRFAGIEGKQRNSPLLGLRISYEHSTISSFLCEKDAWRPVDAQVKRRHAGARLLGGALCRWSDDGARAACHELVLGAEEDRAHLCSVGAASRRGEGDFHAVAARRAHHVAAGVYPQRTNNRGAPISGLPTSLAPARCIIQPASRAKDTRGPVLGSSGEWVFLCNKVLVLLAPGQTPPLSAIVTALGETIAFAAHEPKFTRALFGNIKVTRDLGGVVVRLLASHVGEPGSTPGGVAPRFSHVWESCRTMPLVGGFSRRYPISRRFPSGAAPYSPRFTLLDVNVVKAIVAGRGPLEAAGRGSSGENGSDDRVIGAGRGPHDIPAPRSLLTSMLSRSYACRSSSPSPHSSFLLTVLRMSLHMEPTQVYGAMVMAYVCRVGVCSTDQHASAVPLMSAAQLRRSPSFHLSVTMATETPASHDAIKGHFLTKNI
ncbi:hypothetical protein PR048_017058 [Dryococelus australis]|uniref:Uncharacterized protein n=1 Tax=Dryococelus australis TaxID=614101 RepID=A0ABQ9H8G9_9NEOP|nr:hypothetical protein PR048_017058 [Dryococelus australis]